MKNVKFPCKTKTNLVKPLYRYVKRNVQTPTKHFISHNDNIKLHGNGIDVKKDIKVNTNFIPYRIEKYKVLLPGECQKNVGTKFTKYSIKDVKPKSKKKNMNILAITEAGQINELDQQKENTEEAKTHGVHKNLDSWLTVYPAPNNPDESLRSILFRYFMCQLGIAVFLGLWTTIWLFVIQNFEGPFETKVSLDFAREQNQLVIDLATELRQVTPLSPKWRSIIEKRIELERLLTVSAVGRGARLHPGYFWDLAGTFLFTIYVMTALGFGAPVPQTMWGRSTCLIYAAVAVPGHIYLMVNLSTCMVIRFENLVHRLKLFFIQRLSFDPETDTFDKDSPNSSRNSELSKSKNGLRRNILKLLGILSVGRCVPLVSVLYYVIGVVSFGIARSEKPLESVMFPMLFTTSGGLENVESYVRVFYGLYVEGAMVLLSCALTTLRRNSSGPLSNIADEYRLISYEKQN